MRKLRVLIVDDSLFVRRVIRSLLEDRTTFEVVGEAEDGLSGLHLARTLKPDIITLDQDMPLMTGLDMLCELRKQFDTPVVIVSALPVNWTLISCEAQKNVCSVEKTFSDNPLDLSVFTEELTAKMLRLITKSFHEKKEM